MEGTATRSGVAIFSGLGRDCLACASHASKVVAIQQRPSLSSCSSSSLSLRLASRSSVKSFRDGDQAYRCRRSGSGSSTTILCSSNSDGTRREDRRDGPAFNLSAVVVPMLAAAVIGGVQLDVQAVDGDQFSAPDAGTETVEDMDAQSPSSPFRGLLERMKNRRSAKEKNSPTPATEQQSDSASITNSSPYLKSESATKPPPAPPAPPVRETPKPAPAPPAPPPPPVVLKESPAEDLVKKEPKVVTEVPSPAPASRNSKTHGFFPLFLSQFLLLVATLGGGYVVITTPDSKWTEMQKAMDGYVIKATPVIEDSWTKAKPVAAQVGQQAQRFGEAAKPYVSKAWEAAVPLAEKAAEASKPILKAAQSKVVELLKREKSGT